MSQTEIINLTPHNIVVYNETGETILEVFPPSGEIARASEYNDTIEMKVNGIPVVKKSYGNPVNLPVAQKGVHFIVSGPVLEGAQERTDLLCPDTGPDSVVRDREGNILGVRRFFVYDDKQADS